MQAPHTVTVAKRKSWIERGHAQRVIYLNQRVALLFLTAFAPIWRRSFRNELTASDLVHGSRYVIASNHQSIIDPFFILSQLPYRTWMHLGTVNYFAANIYIDIPFYGGAMLRLGCFPAKAHTKHPYGLEYARHLLRSGKAVLIFPEGRRTKRGETPTRHGVEALAHDPNVMIVPAHIEWTRGRPWRTFRLGIGKPFDGSKMTAQEIMDRVYAQPVA